ncbi:hypothetical protein [Mucilaginibacter sp. NFX135]|uniref:hypothetical protein n=1 Tax=Mucilaginibacter sp. NFX135 TaxID=3402687 RepID=UPI003AFA1096
MKTHRKLSREEMRAVTGGKLSCTCNCFGGAGSWTGSYNNEASAKAAIGDACSGGGACKCAEAAT